MFRKMPPTRNYIVAAGCEDVARFLESFRFTGEDLAYLRGRGDFSDDFLEDLLRLRFTGDVYAMPEGTLAFPNEPLVQVAAPILEAQLIETMVVNQVHFQSLAASKAGRVVTAAGGRAVVDFGARRAHGTDAAIKVARATYLAGGEGTSNVAAAHLYKIPAVGTMAHSYIQAHDSEAAAFEAFEKLYPETTLLVDTYDTLDGVRRVIELSRKLGARFRVRAVRLDSGDLGDLAKRTRGLLDEAGLGQVKIFASSGLDEYEIRKLVSAGAPIDAFGVGTKLAVMEDAPDLDMAYKLVEYAGKGRLKLSSQKLIYPGRKQVFRQVENGRMSGDVIGRFDETLPGELLLRPLMIRGRIQAHASLNESRAHLRREMARLPEPLRGLDAAPKPYRVNISERLQADLDRVRGEMAQAR
jgi:nicotinate phosphoribosyltransferase